MKGDTRNLDYGSSRIVTTLCWPVIIKRPPEFGSFGFMGDCLAHGPSEAHMSNRPINSFDEAGYFASL